MKNSKKVYVVTAHRWGYYESHNYLVGVYSTKTKAMDASKIEEDYRGGNKYICRIFETYMDDGNAGICENKHKIIKGL